MNLNEIDIRPIKITQIDFNRRPFSSRHILDRIEIINLEVAIIDTAVHSLRTVKQNRQGLVAFASVLIKKIQSVIVADLDIFKPCVCQVQHCGSLRKVDSCRAFLCVIHSPYPSFIAQIFLYGPSIRQIDTRFKTKRQRIKINRTRTLERNGHFANVAYALERFLDCRNTVASRHVINVRIITFVHGECDVHLRNIALGINVPQGQAVITMDCILRIFFGERSAVFFYFKTKHFIFGAIFVGYRIRILNLIEIKPRHGLGNIPHEFNTFNNICVINAFAVCGNFYVFQRSAQADHAVKVNIQRFKFGHLRGQFYLYRRRSSHA